ncbi:RNA 2',3'-cyclic phosphodiesterase [Inquilinus limosus]|uniref:RNA 2',3'-cyclic phosphodiesterase n=1 Tax=Inquilinus limosus TaxID=171674 RepID=UPI003F13FB3D
MLRLFVAIAIPAALRPRLSMLQGGVPGARWTDPADFHLTLRFIGEVDTLEAEEIDEALHAIAAPGFSLALDGVGQFGSRRAASTLWAGVATEPALHFLHAKVDRALVAAGQPPDDRAYAPHVTLARLRDAPVERIGRWLQEHGLFRADPFPVDAFHLYQSHVGREGAVYEILESYPLIPTA